MRAIILVVAVASGSCTSSGSPESFSLDANSNGVDGGNTEPAVGEPCDPYRSRGLCLAWPEGYATKECVTPPEERMVPCGDKTADRECLGKCSSGQICTTGSYPMRLCLRGCSDGGSCRPGYKCKQYTTGGACVPGHY